MRTRFYKKNILGYFLWCASRCVFFIRPNTLLLCIFLFCIFLLYRTDPQVEVQIRILLNSLTAIDGHDRQYFNELRARVVSPRIFVRSQSLIARWTRNDFSLPAVSRDFYEALYTRFAWAGGTCPRFAWAGGIFSPVVLLCQFLVLAGNWFWFYIEYYLCT